ncbi:MAG: cytochrome c oxidase subunit II [Gemmatimonadota bacterium]
MIDRLIVQASSYASSIDGLIVLILVFVGFWFVLAEGMFFWLLWKFRARPGHTGQYLTGKEKRIKRWVTIPHALIILCDVVIIVAAIRVWYNVKQHLPEADSTVRVIGQQWAWVFQHPGPDNELDTDDDIFTTDDMYVEVDRTYHFQLESRDVLHDFSVPAFRIKQDAVPGRTITGWFHPTKAGTYDIQCAEICGIGHGVMLGRIHVQEPSQMAAWVSENAPAAAQ